MPLAEALHALMGLLRDSGAPQRLVASGGQYQQSLPQNKTYQLLRLRIDDGRRPGARDQRPPADGVDPHDARRCRRPAAPGAVDVPFELTLCA
jgi:cell division protein ZapD